jgi:hypothetical protein
MTLKEVALIANLMRIIDDAQIILHIIISQNDLDSLNIDLPFSMEIAIAADNINIKPAN